MRDREVNSTGRLLKEKWNHLSVNQWSKLYETAQVNTACQLWALTKKRHAQIWSQCMHSDKKLSSWRWPSAEVISLLSCNWEPSYETVSWCWSNTEKNFSNCNFVTTFRLFQVSCEYLLRSTVKSLQSITGGIIHLNLLEETNQFRVFN